MNGAHEASAGSYRKRHPVRPGRTGGMERGPETGLWERFMFLGAFLTRPGRMGAISPSSTFLAQVMLSECDLAKTDTIVELGPGTGAITSHILERIGKGVTFIPVELDPGCVKQLARRFPRLHVSHDSAERLPELLRQRGKSHANYIFSGLPWANMPADVQGSILNAVMHCLPPGGVFRTFAYFHASWFPTANRFRHLLKANFPHVRRSPVVWKNLPPAFIYHCVR